MTNDNAEADRDAERLELYPRLVDALRPLAEQDCESWECEAPPIQQPWSEHFCEPGNARAALAVAAAIEKRAGGRDGD